MNIADTGTITDHFLSANFAPANKDIAITGVKLNGCGTNLKMAVAMIIPVKIQNLVLLILIRLYYKYKEFN